MDETEDVMSVDSSDSGRSGVSVKPKPKKRSLVERELRTNLTARVTSPVVCEGNTSRYGRARRLKTDSDFYDTDKAVATALKSPRVEKTPIKSPPAYKMHAVNSQVRIGSQNPNGNQINNQLDSIYNLNVSLSRFGSEEKSKYSPSPVKKFPKIYSRQDLLQTKEKEKEETIMLIKNMFSPAKSAGKQSNNHVENIQDRSVEKYMTSSSIKHNGLDTSSVVKTLDFDGKKSKKSKSSREGKVFMSKNELFELEAQCAFQLGDMAWARIGTFPFWPCIVTREPGSEMFVKKKLFGLKERDVIHVTFFCDNGRRSWVLDKLLRPFLGQQEFENARSQFTPEEKKKDPRLYAAFFVSDKKQSLWNSSVLEAEALMKEPKRLRIDIFYDNLEKSRMQKHTPKGQKLSRADSDVSLSESLFDSLFSEEDGKDDSEKSRKRNNSLDVSEVVTACLDNMAAKSGLANIQKQSHMDRWLQKAKSNTPEKTSFKVTISVESVDEIKENTVEVKENKVKESTKNDSKKKKYLPKESSVPKPYIFRKPVIESQNQVETTFCTTAKVESLSKVHENEIIMSTNKSKDSFTEIPNNVSITNGVSDSESDKVETLQKDNLPVLEQESLTSNSCDTHLSQSSDEDVINKCKAPVTSNVQKENCGDSKICQHENIDVAKKDTHEINKIKEYQPEANQNELLTDIVNNVKKSTENLNELNEIVNEPESVLRASIDGEGLLNEKQRTDIVNDVKMSAENVKGFNEIVNESESMLNTSKDSDVIDCDGLLNDKAKSISEKKSMTDKNVEQLTGNFNEPNETVDDELDISMDSDKTDCEGLLNDKAKSTPVKDIATVTDVEKLIENVDAPNGIENDMLNISMDSDKTDCEGLLNDKTKSLPQAESLTVNEVEKLIENINEHNEIANDVLDTSMDSDATNRESLLNIEATSTPEKQSLNTVDSACKTPLEKKYCDKESLKHVSRVLDNPFDSGVSLVQHKIDKSNLENHAEQDYCNNIDERLNLERDHVNKTKYNEISQIKAKDYVLTIDFTKGLNQVVDKPTEVPTSENEDIKLKNENDLASPTPVEKVPVNKVERSIVNVRALLKQQLEVKAPANKEATLESTKTATETVKQSESNTLNGTISNVDQINKLTGVSKEAEYKTKLEQDDGNDVECLSDEDFDTISINSAISEISITETEKLAFRRGLPESLINGFHGDDFVDKIKEEPQDLDAVSINSESDNVPLKGLKLRSETKASKKSFETDSLKIRSENYNVPLKDVKLRSEAKTNKKFVENNKSEMNSESDNVPLKHLKLRPEAKTSKKSAENDKIQMNSKTDNVPLNVPELKTKKKTIDKNKSDPGQIMTEKNSELKPKNDKDIKVEQITKYEAGTNKDTEKQNHKLVPKVGKVILHRIDIEKYLDEPLSVRKSKRLNKLRNHKEKTIDEVIRRKELIPTQSKDNTAKDSLKVENLTTPNKSNESDVSLPVDNNISKSKEPSELEKDKVPPPKEKRIKVKQISELVSQEKSNNICANKPDSEKEDKAFTGVDVPTVNSDVINVSSKRKLEKTAIIKKEKMEHPEFKLYLEVKQDRLIDEHPELTLDEIVAYLYKTWQYEQNQKNDAQKTDDIEPTELIKTEESELPSTYKLKRNRNDKKKSLDAGKQSKKITDFIEVTSRDKPKRKVSQHCYYEDFSDIEDEIQMFEIFRQKPKEKKSMASSSKNEKDTIKEDTSKQESTSEVKNEVKTETDHKIEITTSTPEKEGAKCQTDSAKIGPEATKGTDATIGTEAIKRTEETKEEIAKEKTDAAVEEYYTEEELYFEQLTQPKPNVFKGYIREKVCEICEKKSNLVKCKGCNGMFHADCVKKEFDLADTSTQSRGRKKKKKPKGRKPKSSTDSTLDSECHSDEKSQDPNASSEFNDSIDNFESHTIVDAENFEAQLEAKMKELLENTTNDIQYDSYSSDDGLDWRDTETGKCKIVDIKVKEKPTGTIETSDFKCNNCQKYDTPICFVCKSAVSPKTKSEIRQRCQVSHCHKYYHLECLDHWPQTQFNGSEPSKQDSKIVEPITCPRHVCHTCVCDDPRGCKTRFSGDKLARCVRCPATYHTFTKCLPAGTEILTASHIICPRHCEHKPGKIPCHVNTGWCFICALGGSLICCEYCPTSFHAECLNISPPEGGYMCEDCETGRLPLYGEMVWVKLGHYRWWPGLILHPSEIPSNIMAVKHSLGEFVVRFFGQYDHYWVNRGRVFPFQEGDTGRISSQKSKIDEAFTLAMEHANKAFEILKNIEPNEEENLDIASSLLPPQYVKLKVNKPCGSLCGKKIEIEESSLTQCDCNPDEEEPCGPDSHCLNRMLLTECGPTCRAGERCQNRAFERREYPALVPYRTPHRGWGLKTTEDIKAGQFVIEYVGELIDMDEFHRRMRWKHEVRDENFYFLTLDKERMIDAGPKGNLARFMNHCCEPNCETQKWTVLGDVRVGLFAIHDIPANTEVTFNYNLECAGIDKKRCMCGAKRCSGYIGAKPKQEESQPKKPKLAAKRTNKKRKNAEESPSASKSKAKRPVGRPAKPRELTEIEKDLLIIKNATSAVSSDSEGSSRLNSEDLKVNDESKPKDLKVSEEVKVNDLNLNKEVKVNDLKLNEEVKDLKIKEEKEAKDLKINEELKVKDVKENSNNVVNETEKKPLKRKRVNFSAEDKSIAFDSAASPSAKKMKLSDVSENSENVEKDTVSVSAVGD